MGIAIAAVLCACSTVSAPHAEIGSVAGSIYDTRAKRFIAREDAFEGAAAARFVILGEVHDNAIHHRLQAEVLEAMLRRGRAPMVAMEQFDREHQPLLDAARAKGERNAGRIADAGRFDRKGWRWPDYQPLVEIAAANGLAILAANLSRSDARAVMQSGRPADGLAAADPDLRAALERDIVEGHCGVQPPAQVLAGMIEAQRARDSLMARTLAGVGPGGAILIAGAGHARRDRGVPAYLPAALRDQLLSIGFVEVNPGGKAANARFAGRFDLVWFTPRAEREDPCKNFRLPSSQ